MSNIHNVTVFGTGVLGSQIMMQAAYHGKKVIGYDIEQELLDELPQRWEWIRSGYQQDLGDEEQGYDAERFEQAIANISTTTQVAEALEDCDLVIEAVPENIEIKKTVWSQIGDAAPQKTIFCTNTSSLRPSDFAEATGRKNRFLALHFANEVWKYNTGEVMPTQFTDDETFNTVLEFASEIGLAPIPVRKETPGYLLNSLLIPFLDAGAKLYVNGVANPQEIDKTWRTATGAPNGPFEIYDVVGFNVAYNISKNSDDPDLRAFAEVLKTGIDAGRAGIANGAGFYTYDNKGNNTGVVKEMQIHNLAEISTDNASTVFTEGEDA